jgi:hypothetical protein
MVEGGENDSFDTSILHDDEDFITSSGSQQTGSQPFSIGGSQPWSIGGSQDDNIENFLIKAEDDEQVLLRTPFRPSIPKEVRQSSRDDLRHRSPEPEFYMPRVDVDSPRRASTRSSMTVRASDPPPTPPQLRRRQGGATGSHENQWRARGGEKRRTHEEQASLGGRASTSLSAALLEILSWVFRIFGLALRYAQKPLAILVSLYITFGGVIMLQNMANKSLHASLSPLCSIPGVSWMDLPFCPDPGPEKGAGKRRKQPVEFDGLMDIQDQFEHVLEKAAQGVSLPVEMKRSEASIRDLRTMVRYSGLNEKEELVLEFDSFIDTARTASNDLQKFNTHVGSAVDWVISMNRWTSRHLDSLDGHNHNNEKGGLIGVWTNWIFAPFQPAVFSERHLLDRYVEHTALVSDKIGGLILEAQEVLRTLSKAEGQLGTIHDFVHRTQKMVQSRKDEILWTLWTLVGANNRHLDNLNTQLSLLKRVNAQRIDAVKQVNDLIMELEKIQAGLGDLRDRVAEPGLVRGAVDVPLSVHIETINRGVDRLEAARSRIRAVENDRIREVLARGKEGERLIEQA